MTCMGRFVDDCPSIRDVLDPHWLQIHQTLMCTCEEKRPGKKGMVRMYGIYVSRENRISGLVAMYPVKIQNV